MLWLKISVPLYVVVVKRKLKDFATEENLWNNYINRAVIPIFVVYSNQDITTKLLNLNALLYLINRISRVPGKALKNN